MRKIIVEIEREKAEYIERLNFELGFAKDVIQRIIESHPNDPDIINSDAFKAYQKKGVELEAEYKLAVQEIEKLYIPGAIKKHKYNWILPNNSTKLEINIMCNCEIEGIENEKNGAVHRTIKPIISGTSSGKWKRKNFNTDSDISGHR